MVKPFRPFQHYRIRFRRDDPTSSQVPASKKWHWRAYSFHASLPRLGSHYQVQNEHLGLSGPRSFKLAAAHRVFHLHDGSSNNVLFRRRVHQQSRVEQEQNRRGPTQN